MKFYKILHIPTGMFYKPSKHGSKSNISKKGKVYQQKPNIESWLKYFDGYVYHHPTDTYPYFETRDTKLEDWKICEYHVS